MNRQVANVNIAACWKHGTEDALDCLRDSGIFTPDELSVNKIAAEGKGVDMLRPYLRTVGVRAGDVALIDLSDADDDVEDQPATNGLNQMYYTLEKSG